MAPKHLQFSGILRAIAKETYGLRATVSQMAEDVSTVAKTMPIISKDVEDIHNVTPAILDKVDVIHDTLLPTLMQQLSVGGLLGFVDRN